MNFLSLSDLHGHIITIPDDLEYDAIFLAGDILPDNPEEYTWLRPDYAMELHTDCNKFWKSQTKPIYAVHGNHDTHDICSTLDSCMHVVDNRVVHIKDDLWIAGLQWYGEAYYDLPTNNCLKPLCDFIATECDLLVPPNHRIILMTHYPPQLATLWTVGCGPLGHSVINDLINKIKPVAVLCGHIHEAANMRETLLYSGGECKVYCLGSFRTWIEL